MITAGAKLWLAVTAFALVAAEVYFVATAGEDGGALTLLFIAAGAAIIAGATIAIRDGDAAPVGAEGEREPVVVRSALPAPWPVFGALGAAVTAVGFATGGLLLYVGFGVMAVALAEWMVQSWAERATADPAYNKALRHRIMFPFEVPVLGLAGVGFIILSFSRVLLALPNKDVSTLVAIVVAAAITAGAFVIANRPRISSNAVAWLLAVAAVVLLGAGVIGGVAGEREIEHKEAEHAE